MCPRGPHKNTSPACMSQNCLDMRMDKRAGQCDGCMPKYRCPRNISHLPAGSAGPSSAQHTSTTGLPCRIAHANSHTNTQQHSATTETEYPGPTPNHGAGHLCPGKSCVRPVCSLSHDIFAASSTQSAMKRCSNKVTSPHHALTAQVVRDSSVWWSLLLVSRAASTASTAQACPRHASMHTAECCSAAEGPDTKAGSGAQYRPQDVPPPGAAASRAAIRTGAAAANSSSVCVCVCLLLCLLQHQLVGQDELVLAHSLTDDERDLRKHRENKQQQTRDDSTMRAD